jgi:agarase
LTRKVILLSPKELQQSIGKWVRLEKVKKSPYYEAIKKKYGEREAWSETVIKRLKKWGLNSLGAWCYDSDLRQNFPYTEMLNIAWTAGQEDVWVTGGFPDVFSKKFEITADKICREICLDKKDDSQLSGYFLDNELRWRHDWRSNESMLKGYIFGEVPQEEN